MWKKHNQITSLRIQLENIRNKQQSQCDRICVDARLQTVQAKPPKKAERFPQIFHSPLGVRRTVKSSTSTVAVVAGSLHPDEKPLSAKLRRYQGFGVDVALQLSFNVADLDPLLLITNNLMERANRPALEVQNASIRG